MDKSEKILFVFGVGAIVFCVTVIISSITTGHSTEEYIEKHCNKVPGAYVKTSNKLSPVYSCILNKQERANEK